MKQLNVVTGEGTRRRNMNCDTGNKTQVFHKARRRSCSEQDNMGSKPLRGIHVSLFARRRKQAANKETDVATCMCGRDVGSWLWRFIRERTENTSLPWFEHEKPLKEIGLGHGATATCARVRSWAARDVFFYLHVLARRQKRKEGETKRRWWMIWGICNSLWVRFFVFFPRQMESTTIWKTCLA